MSPTTIDRVYQIVSPGARMPPILSEAGTIKVMSGQVEKVEGFVHVDQIKQFPPNCLHVSCSHLYRTYQLIVLPMISADRAYILS
jgi:hypothetical protein